MSELTLCICRHCRANVRGCCRSNVTVSHTPPTPFSALLQAPVYRGTITKAGPAAISIRASFRFDALTGVPALELQRQLVNTATGEMFEHNTTAVSPSGLLSTAVVSFSTSPQSLPPGQYSVTLRCFNASSPGRKELGNASFALTRVSDAVPDRRKVFIDDDLRTIVRDQHGQPRPFFPLGLYTCESRNGLPQPSHRVVV